MTSKKYKKISILLLFSMFISFLPKITFAASLTSVNAPTLTDNTMFSDFFSELTEFINERVGSDITDQVLTNNLANNDFEKAIAQRELIRKSGLNTIQNFISDPEKKKFMLWLFNNLEAMTLFLEGGDPASDYIKAFEVWYEIWSKDPDSHIGYELKLAVSSALMFGNGVPHWYTSRVLVTPYDRYNYFKVREAEGKFPVSMKTRNVWEIKNTISAEVSNADLDYVRDVIHAGRYNAATQKVDIIYLEYTAESKYKDENGKPYDVQVATADQFYGPNATIKDVYEIGGVCGAESKYGTAVVNSFGIPGFVVGQPGHAAHLYYSPTHPGKWELGYDIYGLGESTLTDEYFKTPFTNYDHMLTRVPYWVVYERARENEASLHKTMQLKWISNAIKDRELAQAVRKIAIETNKWNIDIWRDYINSMKSYCDDELEKLQIPSNSIVPRTTSENPFELVRNVLDNDPNTIWHTRYATPRTYLPQSVSFDFDKIYKINKLKYVPRKNGGNGTITKYNIYTSMDGINYELATSGELANDDSEKIINFDARDAKSIKFEATEGVENYASASEIKVYKASEIKPIPDQKWREVAQSIINELGDEPIAAIDLFRSIKYFVLTPDLPAADYQRYAFDLSLLLDKASMINSDEKAVVKFIRDKLQGSGLLFADFNFDGVNAGKLLGANENCEYSLNGGNTWKRVTEKDMKLTDEEIALITSQNGIKVRIVGESRSALIPIEKGPSLSKICVNDDINKIFDIDDKVYYSIDNGVTWTRYENDEKLPDLSGDLTLMLKIPSKGKKLGSEVKTFNLTSKTNEGLLLPNDIAKIEANEEASNPVSYAFDGNINSYWHTNYSNNRRPLPLSIIFELKEKNDINKLEYLPRQDNSLNGLITKYNIYSSEDGVDFKKVATGNWQFTFDLKSVGFDAKNAKFIKFEVVEGFGGFATAAEIKLYRNIIEAPKVDFSFDGDNAGKLMGIDDSMEYSIDGGSTWKTASGNDMALSETDLTSITAVNGIQARIKGNTKVTKIEITSSPEAPSVEANDQENTIKRLDSTMEYSVDGGKTWTKYSSDEEAKFEGDVTVLVRVSSTGKTLAGKTIELSFKENDVAPIVDFSFDGDNAGKLMGIDDSMEYSIDGGSTWKTASGNDMALSETDLTSITAANGIKVRIKGNTKVTKIEITSSPEAPSVEANDQENTIKRLDSTMEYSVDGGKTWTKYSSNQEAKFEGDVTALVRVASTGKTLAGKTTELSFKENEVVTSLPTITTIPTDTTNTINTTNEVKEELAPKVDFSFDGDNAGKLMGIDDSMEYSIDGGSIWKNVSGNDMALSETDLTSITAENGIQVRIKGNTKVTKIEITSSPEAPSVETNDQENTIKGLDSTMEYSVDGGKTWTKYSSNQEAKFEGDVKVLVRVASTGKTLAGKTTELSFKENEVVTSLPTITTIPTDTTNTINTTNEVKEELAPKVDFSFDGDNAGKLMGIDDSMEYSIDGGSIWKTASGNDMALSETDLTSITAENGIKVRIKGNTKVTSIEITSSPEAPSVEANDQENTIKGLDSTMEYSVDGGKTWTKYSSNQEAKFEGDVKVLVRVASTGKTLAGKTTELSFKENEGNTNSGNNVVKPNNVGNTNSGNNAVRPNNVGNTNGGNNAVRPNNVGNTNGGNNVVKPNNVGNTNSGNTAVKPNNVGNTNGGNTAVKPNNVGNTNGGNTAVRPNNVGNTNGGNNAVRPNNVGNTNGGNNVVRPNNVGNTNGGNNVVKPNNVGNTNSGNNVVRPNNVGNTNGGNTAVKPNNVGNTNGGNNAVNPNRINNGGNNLVQTVEPVKPEVNENEESLNINFSFDGENTKMIGTDTSMEYSIDGGKTWKNISENNMILSKDDISSINAENGIQIRKIGTSKATKIEVSNGPEAPTLEVDDTENIVKGLDSSMEYSVDGGKTWVKYSEGDENKFTGDLSVLVRVASNAKTLPGKTVELKFTENKVVSNKESKINPVSVATTVAIICLGGLSIFGFRTGRIKF